MRILHTSDWHIGKKLKEHDRLDEFKKFFVWLEKIIVDEKVDALIVSGDVFDNKNPSVESQELYYSFLGRVAGKICRHVVITSGNHDSAAFIDAPAEILERCDIHVVGCAGDNEVITLRDPDGRPELIVCAVPFLLEKDVINVKPYDSISRDNAFKAGIINHYSKVIEQAMNFREDHKDLHIPVIAMGHLFLQQGMTQADEGEYSLYVGTAIKLGTDIFPESLAYTALGHLHSSQNIERENIRYSGSPIAMTFGELATRKSVSVVDFEGEKFAGVREIAVPVFQQMERISGDLDKIEKRISELENSGEPVWVEITHTGTQTPGDFREKLEEILMGCENIKVLEVIDKGKVSNSILKSGEFDGKTLGDIEPVKMFQMVMNNKNISPEDAEKLLELYQEILNGIKMGAN